MKDGVFYSPITSREREGSSVLTKDATALSFFESAKYALSMATQIDEIKDIRDKSEAMRLYLKQIGESLEMQNDCAEIKLRAERRIGIMLEDVRPGNPQLSHDATISLSDLGVSRMQSSRWQKIASIPDIEFDDYISKTRADYKELTSAGALRLAKSIELGVHFSSETPEWYTPPIIIDCVIQVMEYIDLDPCSNDADSPNVPARHHFTSEQDGLSHPWHGKVYMNPPYGREIADWVEHLVAEWADGRISEAMSLLPARTDTEWCKLLRDFPRCFLYGRLKFSHYDNSAPFPSMLVYLGHNLPKFIGATKKLGDVFIRATE